MPLSQEAEFGSLRLTVKDLREFLAAADPDALVAGIYDQFGRTESLSVRSATPRDREVLMYNDPDEADVAIVVIELHT